MNLITHMNQRGLTASAKNVNPGQSAHIALADLSRNFSLLVNLLHVQRLNLHDNRLLKKSSYYGYISMRWLAWYLGSSFFFFFLC